MRWLVAILLLALPAFSITYIANRGTWHQAEEFIKDDTDVSSPIELSGSIALVNSVFPSIADHYRSSCLSLCERLLYDSGVERVIVAVHSKANDGDFIDNPANAGLSAIAYYIERQDVCPPGITAFSTAPTHISPGDCLISEEATLAEAEFIYVTRSEEHTSELQSLMRISYDVFCLKKKNIIQINS